jgi:hypothetical protein
MLHAIRLSALTLGLMALATTAVTPTAIAGGPAVSDVNLKLGTFGGSLNPGAGQESVYGVTANLTLPVARDLGLQLDGALEATQGATFYDAGAHLFWRDPGTGLFGLYAGAAHHDGYPGEQLSRIGIEAQHFMDRMTFEGALGYENGDLRNGLYGHAKLDLYLKPDLMISGGATYEGTGYASAGVEWQLANTDRSGVSLFANGDYHANDTYQVLGGMRITFGKSMSLIDRHRRQDPASYLNVDLLATEQAEACPVGQLVNSNACDCAAPNELQAQGGGYICDAPPTVSSSSAL